MQTAHTTPMEDALRRAQHAAQHAPADWNLRDTDSAVSLSDIKGFVKSALSKGTVRGWRVFRRMAGSVCKRARQRCGSAGKSWTKASWDGSLKAAMSVLEGLADARESSWLEGFERAVSSAAAAHLEGLKQQGEVRAARTAKVPRSSPRPRQGQRIRHKEPKAFLGEKSAGLSPF